MIRTAVFAFALVALFKVVLPTNANTIVLHIDDLVHIPPNERADAEAETVRVYNSAGVHMVWKDGLSHVPSAADGMKHLVVVIAGAPPDQTAMRGDTLGTAARDTGRACVYYRRVVFVAHQYARHVASILGIVIAHEVGHLLLPHGGHSLVGIMRADLYLSAWAPRLPPLFTKGEGKTLRAALAR